MEKIKQILDSEKGKDFLIVLIVIMVGLGSFELGRLSKNSQNSGIKIEYPGGVKDQSANAISGTNVSKTVLDTRNLNSSGKNFFASNRGTKYYSIDCSAGKNIKQENRVYFATREEAEEANYTFSSSCR